MPAIVIVIAASIVALAAAAYYVMRDPAYPSDAEPVAHILDRVAAEGSQRRDSWELETAHRAPTVAYTIEQAHTAMQDHIECPIDVCAAKRSARASLVEAGKLHVDTRVGR
ncbi:hypothetical protein ACLMAJ_12270 [Nocardia sp. KC 131]|uniref:hypothetical protein n=1 Tax=Nocardia arseniciresistens TaxID=3392119 RepID=UPI00398EB654